MAWHISERGAAVPYVHQAFPKHVYHVSGDHGFKIVHSDEEWAALGAEWGYPVPDEPASAVLEPAIAEPDADSVVVAPKRGRKANA